MTDHDAFRARHALLPDPAECEWQTLLAAATTEGVMVHEQGTILRANAALARMFGYAPEALVGHSGAELCAPDERPRLMAHIASGSEHPLEGTGLRRDGSTFPCEILGRSVAHHGRTVRVVLVRDLTDRRAMQAELERRARELRAITDTTPDVLTRLDLDRRVVFMSPAVQAATGVPAEAFIGHRFEEFGWPPDILALWNATTDRVLETGEQQTTEFTFPDPQGVARTYHTRVVPEYDETGRIVGVLTTTRDLTAVYDAERKARETEERFRALVEHAGELISIVDPDGTHRYSSPSHALLGPDPAGLPGRNCFDFVHPDDADALRRAFAQALSDPRPTPPVSIRFSGVPGEWHVLALTLTDMRHVPAVGGVVVNSRDVTEQLELQERLRRAQKMEALGQLAGGVAHDFNNVLAAIAGYAQLIADALPDGLARDDAGEILRAAERGAGVVRHLLAFSRRQALDIETLDLAVVVREAARMLRPVLPATVAIALPEPRDAVWVRASRTAIEQIVVNLAVNARDAMPDGGTLTFAVHERVDAEGKHCGMLAVRDTGAGIPGEIRERVFEPFFTTKPVGRGTGLGLSTVYGLVRQLGGAIDLDSTVGRGTTFLVSLPGAADPSVAPPPTHAESAETDGRGRRVLLVEDEPALREFARRVLVRAGWAVATAAHGADALARLERGDPVDVLLTDVAMPVMGGRALAEAAHALRPALPIVLMSGYDERLGDDDGGAITAFVEKPFHVPQLLAVLRHATTPSD